MKKHILLVLKTFVINSACVEASRTREKKYNIIAVIFALLGLFLSVLPIGVTNFSRHGSYWMTYSSQSYALDKGLQYFEDNLEQHKLEGTDPLKYTFYINNNHELEVDMDSWNKANPNGILAYSTPVDNIKRVEIYVNTNEDQNAFNTAVGNLKTDRKCTLIAFGRRTVYAYLYQPEVATMRTSFVGDYLGTTPGTNFLKYRTANNPIATYNNWTQFFEESYAATRFANTWKQIGIMLGVNGGVLIFMGLMVFILTRGKNNPFRIYSFWDGQKIAYYCSLTPGLLSLLGFALSQFTLFLYPLCIGIRTMWLSMRTLRYTAPAKK